MFLVLAHRNSRPTVFLCVFMSVLPVDIGNGDAKMLPSIPRC